MEENKLEFKYKVIGFFITIGLIILICFFIFSKGNIENDKIEKPDEIELMSYAQTVLDDNLINPKYSSYKKDYTFINNTELRYKIEGEVNNEKFWMIIEFIDDTYKDYNLISLQVGNNIIYKK